MKSRTSRGSETRRPGFVPRNSRFNPGDPLRGHTVTDSAIDHLPFARLLGMELLEAGDGRAVGEIDLQEKHTSNPGSGIAHGGVAYSLADTVGGVAIATLTETVTPTVDMRIDYLQPAVGDRIRAEATVVRTGNNVATVDVDVHTEDGDLVATARGTYKTSGATGDSPWERRPGVEDDRDR